MKLPKGFEKTIANTFYDKDIKLLKNTETFDDEGGVEFSVETVQTIKGNVNFNNLGLIKKNYGLEENVDIAITTKVEAEIKVGDKIGYKDKIYLVMQAPIYDSHLLILGQICK